MDWTLFWTIIWQAVIALIILPIPAGFAVYTITSALRPSSKSRQAQIL